MRTSMRVLYIHQYFVSRKGRSGTRSYEFGRYLVERGHKVTIVTSGLANAEFPVGTNEQSHEYEIDGIRIVAIRAGYNDPLTGTALPGWRRMLKFHDFARLAVRVARNLDRPDVVFATHTPLAVGSAGLKLGRLFSVPFVFEVRDLWPEALVNVGALTNPAIIWWMKRVARRLYHNASHIVALSPGMKKQIETYKVSGKKITVIPNSSDLDLFDPNIDGMPSREKLGLENRFAAIYFGAMGIANGLEYIIHAAKNLSDRGNDRIVFVLYGSGGEKMRLQELADSYKLTNVLFYPAVPKEEIARIVSGCDACLTIFRAAREQTWSPNKLFDALAAGKPILINISGWLSDTLVQNQCGQYVDPLRPEALADALVELSLHPTLCRQMGANARQLAEREFDRRKLAAQLEGVLMSTLN